MGSLKNSSNSGQSEGDPIETILVVDDEGVIRDLLVSVIEPMGVQVAQAHSVDSALAVLAKQDINVILCDIKMAGESGLDLLKRLRAANQETPMVLLTGYASREYMRVALAAGATDFLEKPFDPDALVKVLWKALEIDRRQRRVASAITELSKSHPEGGALVDKIDHERKVVQLYRVKGAEDHETKETGGTTPHQPAGKVRP